MKLNGIHLLYYFIAFSGQHGQRSAEIPLYFSWHIQWWNFVEKRYDVMEATSQGKLQMKWLQKIPICSSFAILLCTM